MLLGVIQASVVWRPEQVEKSALNNYCICIHRGKSSKTCVHCTAITDLWSDFQSKLMTNIEESFKKIQSGFDKNSKQK